MPFQLLLLLGFSGVQVFCQSEPSAPYITLGGRVLPNNSYLSVYEIGTNASTGIQCHTDLSNGSHDGQWYSPTGGRLFTSPSYYVPFYTADIEQGIALVLQSSPIRRRLEGIFRCDIKTNSTSDTDESESVFVGIYHYGG